jgi:hypothetical protein
MKFFALLTLIVCAPVFGAVVTVTEIPVDFFRPNTRASFAVNKDLGRAWVEIEQHDNTNGSGEAGNVSLWTRAIVNGLVFNESLSKITLTYEGQLFECADVVRKWYGIRITNTGCELETKRITRTIDDGYNTFKRDFILVTLKTK